MTLFVVWGGGDKKRENLRVTQFTEEIDFPSTFRAPPAKSSAAGGAGGDTK